MTEHGLTILAILIPAAVALIIAWIKRPKKYLPPAQPPTELDVLKEDMEELKTQLERQHIKIDDLSERLAWLEGREGRK
jgi:hypothetical protein